MPYKNLEDRRKHYQKNKDVIKARVNAYRIKNREKILERRRVARNGCKDRINQKRREGWALNRDLRRSYQRISSKKFYYRHLDKVRGQSRDRNRELKYEVFSRYSNNEQPYCAACGFADIRALCIDHIKNDGASHRREVGGGGTTLYRNLKKRNFPEGFQVLCSNCNQIKEHERIKSLWAERQQ